MFAFRPISCAIRRSATATATSSSSITLTINRTNLIAPNTTPSVITSSCPIAQQRRHTSTLPVTTEYTRRIYPFPTILESDIPPDYSKWLYYHRQFPDDLPQFRSKLTVDIRDLGLNPTSRMVLREIVGSRYDRRKHTISFVSRNLSTAQANENRVFQQLDACLLECREIANQLELQGLRGRSRGAAHDRLLKPVPEEADVRKRLLAERRAKINELRQLGGLAPLKPKDVTETKTKLSRAQRNAVALGMTEEEKTKFVEMMKEKEKKPSAQKQD